MKPQKFFDRAGFIGEVCLGVIPKLQIRKRFLKYF